MTMKQWNLQRSFSVQPDCRPLKINLNTLFFLLDKDINMYYIKIKTKNNRRIA